MSVPAPPAAAPPPSSALDGDAELSPGMKALFAIISVCLVLGSGLVSGLTLGLLSQDEMDLEILRRSGTPREAARAARVSAVLANPHFLLCTLVLVNAACSVSLPIFLDRLLNAVASILISVTAILIFGEILPQAICARHGVAIGAFFAPLVRVMMVVLSPIAWPLAKVLDYSLGRTGTALNRPQLQAMVSLHHEREGMGGNLTKDEVGIISGALRMTGRTGRRAMTPIHRAFMVSDAERLDASLRERILRQGHSRIPVYRGDDRTDLVGLILAKELLHFWGAGGDQPGAAAAPRVGELLLRQLPRLPADTSLYDLLNVFQTGRSHMAALMDAREDGGAAAGAGGAGGGAAAGEGSAAAAAVAGAPPGSASAAAVATVDKGGAATTTTTTTKAVATAGDATAITSSTTLTTAAAGAGAAPTTTTTAATVATAAASQQQQQQPQQHVAVSFATEVATELKPPAAAQPSLGRRLLQRLSSATAGRSGGGGGGGAGGPRTFSGGSAASTGAGAGGDNATNLAACATRTYSGCSEAAAAAAAAEAAAEAEAQRAQRALDAAASGVPVGIITLEDVLEELMGEEILDETDNFADVVTRESKDSALASMLQDVPPHMRKLLHLHLFEAGKVLARATPTFAAGAGAGGAGATGGGGVGPAWPPSGMWPAPPSRARTPLPAAAALARPSSDQQQPPPPLPLAPHPSQSLPAAVGAGSAASSGTGQALPPASAATPPPPPPLPPVPPPAPTGTRPMMVPLPRGAGLAQKPQHHHHNQQQQQQQQQQAGSAPGGSGSGAVGGGSAPQGGGAAAMARSGSPGGWFHMS